jgi:hypothetical protein
MEDISLITLNNYSLLTITNPNGSAVEIKLTPAQLDYIEERISATKSVNQLLTAMKAGN